jgi:hypothetical protein
MSNFISLPLLVVEIFKFKNGKKMGAIQISAQNRHTVGIQEVP